MKFLLLMLGAGLLVASGGETGEDSTDSAVVSGRSLEERQEIFQHTYDMLSGLIVLNSVDALERVIVASEERLVLLFKHSVTCGTSAQAHDELVAYLTVKASTPPNTPSSPCRPIGMFQMQWQRA